MKLYYTPGTCSLAIHILLIDTGQPHTLERVDSVSKTTQSGVDYWAINPKGAVPLLELDNGQRLSEGPVIAQFIADTTDRRDLMPAPGDLRRYRVMEWQNFVTSELHKGYGPLFKTQFDEAAKTAARAALRSRYQWVDQQLADRSYLTGDNFTAADAYLFVVTNWARMVDLDLSDLTHLQAFQQSVAERPAVHQAMAAEGLRKAA